MSGQPDSATDVEAAGPAPRRDGGTAPPRVPAAAVLDRLRRLRREVVAGGAVLAAALAAVPLLTDNRYVLLLGTLTLLWMGLASCWNLVTGFTGYISFGHAALLGLGAYTVGLATTRYGMALVPALVLAPLLVALFSLVFGLLALRLQGHYFAIATLGLAEATRVLVEAARGFTQGTFGFGLPVPITGVKPAVFYYALLAALAVTVAVCTLVLWSGYGARLLAIREDETAASSLGINTTWHKLSAFVLSGALTGLFGGLYAWVLGYLTPEAVFSSSLSLQIVVMTIIGGLGTVLGPLLGGAIFYLLAELVLVNVPQLHLLVFGTVLALAMLFLRRGVIGTLEHSRVWPRGLRL